MSYSIGTNGLLSAIATPALLTSNPTGKLHIDPTGKYAYVLSGSSIYEYTVGANGVLTPMFSPSIQVASTTGVQMAAMDPTGKYIYVFSNNAGISAYSIGTNGALSTIPVSTPAGVGVVNTINIDPTGKYIYFTMPSNAFNVPSSVGVSSINSNGTLTAMNFVSVPSNSISATTIDPSGKYLYVASYNPAVIYQYTIGTFGVLSLNATITLPTGGLILGGGQDDNGTSAQEIAIDPASKYAYILYTPLVGGNGTVLEYSIGYGGSLSPLSTASIATTPRPKSITVDSTGKYVYVGDFTGNISEYSIGANGVLSSLGAPISTSSNTITTVQPSYSNNDITYISIN